MALIRRPLPALALAGGLLLSPWTRAEAQPRRIVAFGDSITRGFGDDAERGGYPGRLPALLAQEGIDAVVENRGVDGEATAEALSRIDSLTGTAADTLILMEGTNDIARNVSVETIGANLDRLVRKARQRGFGTVLLATAIPRGPGTANPASRRTTELLAWEIREVAWALPAPQPEPFDVFSSTPRIFDDFYFDALHPNGRGYDLLADLLRDFLVARDRVPPVPAFILPANGAVGLPPNALLEAVLFDAESGLDLATLTLTIDGAPVGTEVLGDTRRAQLRARPGGLAGRPRLGVAGQDRASPPNVAEREVSRFTISGTIFLLGDLDQSGRVDGADLVQLALAFGANQGSGRFDPDADLDRNRRVDGSDLALLAANFGQSSF